MTDLSQVSTEDLLKAAGQSEGQPTGGDLSDVSTEDLVKSAMQSPEHHRSIGEQALRQLGLTGRYLVEGGTALPAMVGDAANAAVNLGIKGVNSATGSNIKPLGSVSGALQGGLDAAGLPNPETRGERIIGDISKAVASVPAGAAGAEASGVKALAPLTQKFGQQATAAAGSGLGGSVAKEAAPDNTLVQILAGLAGGAVGGVRTGGPSAKVAQRMADFKAAGIDPSLGDVTQSPTAQRVQKVVQAVPLASDVVKANEVSRLNQASKAADEISAGYGQSQSPNAMGQTAQDAVENYRFGKAPGMTDREALLQPTRNSSVSRKAEAVYNQVPIAGDASIPVPNTVDALKNATSRFDNPELSSDMANGQISKWGQILDRANGQLSWDDLRNLRSEVRYMRGNAKLDPTIDDRALSQLDQALSKDMLDGAKSIGGDRAAQTVQRADKYYALSMDRIDSGLKSIYRTNRPEAAYQQIESALSAKPSSGDLQKLQSLKRVMTDGDWNDLSATIIDRLGRPTPGTVPAPGLPDFSIGQFVTKYAGMSDPAKNLLFNGAGRGDLRDRLDSLYRAASDMKATERLANASNSGNHVISAAVMGGAMTAPTTTLTALLGANVTARALYNPTFIDLATKTLKATSPQAQAAVATQVARFAAKNPDMANESQNLLRSLGQPRAEDSEESK